MDMTFSAYDTAMWMCRAVSSDGVVSESEVRVLQGFCRLHGLDADEMMERAMTYCEYENPEVVELGREYVKGYGFEKFVVRSLCRDSGFQLLTWRGDKSVDGIVAKDDRLPDLRLSCQRIMPEREFFVECKYRRLHTGWNGFKRWQLDRYADFSRKKRVKVIMVYGTGGSAEHPQRVFVMPVWELIRKNGEPDQFELHEGDLLSDAVYRLLTERH